MPYHLRLLTQQAVPLLLIVGIPLALTTNALGMEEKTDLNETVEVSQDIHQIEQQNWSTVELDYSGKPQFFYNAPADSSESEDFISVNLDDDSLMVLEILNELDGSFNSYGSQSGFGFQFERDENISEFTDDLVLANKSDLDIEENLQSDLQPSQVKQERHTGTTISSPQDSIKTSFEIPSSQSNEYAQKPQMQKPQASTQSTNTSLVEGNSKLDEEKYDEAVAIFDQALHEAESTRDQIGVAKALSGKTAARLGLRQYLEAENTATEALTMLGELNQKYPAMEVDLLLRRGYAYLGQEKLSEVEATVKQITAIIPKLKASENSAGLLVSLADLQYALGDKDAGNQSAQKAVGFLQKNPDPSGAIAVLSRLAVSQYASERPEETVETLDRMVELVDKLKIDKLEERTKKISLRQATGGLYLKLAETEDRKIEKTDRSRQLFEKARRSFDAAWSIAAQDDRTEENAKILLGLGKVYLGLRRNEEAADQAEQVLKIIQELEKAAGIQEPKKEPRSWFDRFSCGAEKLFTQRSSCDDKDAELALLNQPETVHKQMKRDARNIIAAARLDQGRYAESDVNLREALKITREMDDKLNGTSKTLRQIQGFSGLLALLPIGVVSEVGSYINTTAAGFDQLVALPQGGFSLLAKINADMLSNNKRRSLDDLKKQQEEAHARRDASAEAKILLQLGSGYLGIGRYDNAGRAFKDAATLFKQLNQAGQPVPDDEKAWAVKEAEALLGSGRSLFLERKYTEARAVTQQAKDISEREGDSLGLGNAWLTLGNIDLAQSNLLTAKKQLEKALAIFVEAKDDEDARLGKANTLLALGTVASNQRDYKSTLPYTEEAIGIFQVTRNELESARARLVRGSAYNSLGEHKKALDDAQKALFVFKDLGDRMGEISALNNIGDALQSQKRYEQAIKFYGLSAELQKDLQKNIQKPKPKTGWLITVFRASSFFLPMVGTLGQVGVKVYNALSLAQNIVYLSESATGSLGSGISYLSLGDYDQAMEAFDQVRKASENKDRLKEAEALLGLSNTRLSFDNKDYSMAKQDAERATRLFNEIGNRAGAAYGLLAQGIAYNRLGKSQSDPKKRSEFFGNAFVAIQQALSTFQDLESPDPAGLAQAYSALADLLVDKGQENAAIIFYKKSIEVTEGIRRNIPEGELRTAYVGKVVETYRRLIYLLLSQARVPEAQQILELLKAQEIREYTGIARASIGDDNKIVYADGIEKEIAQRYDDKIISLGLQLANCKQGCQALEEQRNQLVAKFEELVKPISEEIKKRLIGQDELIFNPKSLSSSAKKIVQPCENFKGTCPKPVEQLNTMLVYPFVAQDKDDTTKYKLWLLWASPQGVSLAVERKVDRQLLEQTVFGFYALVSSPSNLVELQQKSKQLYSWLIQPLEKQLEAGKVNNLVFVLDRFLRYIPMAALFDGKEYLIQKGYQISTIISAKETDMTDRPSFDAKNTGVLAMGLSEERLGFPALKDVSDELKGIVRTLSSATVGVYPGRIFSNQEFDLKALTNSLGEKNVQKYKYKILHIATHGKFVPGSDRSSFLVLGVGDKNTLTKLTIDDIDKNLQYGLTNIHLVVLSACQTALGGNTKSRDDKLDGLEIPGLSYSFISENRAKAVLASLWLVNSHATSRLMQAFYSNLANSKNPITKAEALRRAQLFILTGKNQYIDETRGFKIELAPGTVAPISDSSHPFFWAPFTLIGNGL